MQITELYVKPGDKVVITCEQKSVAHITRLEAEMKAAMGTDNVNIISDDIFDHSTFMILYSPPVQTPALAKEEEAPKAVTTSTFAEDISKFNGIYKLPVATNPTFALVADPVARLIAFKDILKEELDEIDDVIKEIMFFQAQPDNEAYAVDALTSLADLLGDIQVYCASEMAKFGLPLNETLSIIMKSNFSKLGADGLPIYDERGKVQKGPNYWKPEPMLNDMLAQRFNVI